MTKNEAKETAKVEAIQRVNQYIKPGDTINTILDHVSKSGMSRRIRLVVPVANLVGGESHIIDITYDVATILDWRMKDGSLVVTGCGMDVGFEAVYDLARELYPNGFDCVGDHCPSNDHTNGSTNKHHRDGGYALRQSWL